MGKTRRAFQNLLLSLLSILFIFAVLEISARVYLTRFASESDFIKYASLDQLEKNSKFSSGTSFKYSSHRYIGYIPTPNFQRKTNRHNSLGYRGDEVIQPKPEGEYRIVCLGGSTTYTVEIDDYHLSFPHLLEKDLIGRGYKNVRVVNAGANGYSSWESLINFELRVLDLEPDMIIVYHGINDVHPMLVHPPEVYRGDNSGRRITTALFMPSIIEHSTLIRMLMIRGGYAYSHAAFARTIDKAPETYYGREFLEQKLLGTYPEGIFRKVSAKEMLAANPPIYFKRNIKNIALLAKGHRIETVLATFAYSPLFEDKPRVASEEYASALDELNGVLKAVAVETGVHLFDFAATFPKSKRYYVDGRHVNVEGAKLKAKLFADYISGKNLIP